jgi:DNA processing protein
MSSKVEEINDTVLRLLCVDGLGAQTLHALVRRIGGLSDAAHAILSGEDLPWLPSGALQLLKKRMERIEIDACRWSAVAVDASIVTVMDDDFPQLLCPLPSCPAMLWYQGDISCIQQPSVAIVGSRRCTTYGIEQTNTFSTEIASSGIAIISGGARGIDAAAHRSALRCHGQTAAVLGSGLSVVYPPEHDALFKSIVTEGGVIVSEFPCNKPPQPANFPRRNRIVSGLSSTVLVVEAARRSGALITARIAVEEHGRHAFAIPGRLGDGVSAGCLRSIHDGWVELALDPAVICNEAKQAWQRLSSTCQKDSSTCEGPQ